MKFLFQALASIAVIYVGVLVLVYFYQPRLVFLPDVAGRALVGSPADLGLDYEEVWLESPDGVRIHAWYVPAAGAAHTLVFFHGNAGNISHRLDSLRIFHELGLDVLMLEYRGYGQSEGKPSEPGIRLDAQAAWDFLVAQKGKSPDEIVLFGRSLGGAVAAQLAADRTPLGLVLESTFTSVPDIGAEVYPWLPVRWLSSIHYDSLALVRNIDVPLLVVHSPGDDIIPFHHGRRLFEAAREPKRFLQIDGGHNGGYMLDVDAYRDGLKAFIESL